MKTVTYLTQLLQNGTEPMNQNYQVEIRTVADSALLSAVRYVHEAEAEQTMGALPAQMREAGPVPMRPDIAERKR
ncbi:hypothetical protein ACSMXN_09095 [Jatrophihabitans sp. DSM 45814]